MGDLQTDSCRERYPLYFRVANYFRRRRMEYFFKEFDIHRQEHILDVGGETFFWKDFIQVKKVTILNLYKTEESDRIKSVTYKGGRFPFRDREFDLVFSNSTIEHVGDSVEQALFASEIRRCGKRYFVQTPSFWFPFEPHSFIPGFQFLPVTLKKLARRLFSKSLYPIEELLAIRLLTKRKIRKLFPDARIVTERFFLFPKSYYSMDRQGK